MYGGLASINSHCRVYHGGFHVHDPSLAFITNPNADTDWREYTEASPIHADQAIHLGFHYPTIDAGASVTFKWAYVLSPGDVAAALVSLASLSITAPSSVVTGTSVLFQTALDVSKADCVAAPDSCIVKTVKFEIFTADSGSYATLATVSGTADKFTYFTLFDSTEYIVNAEDTLATMQVTVTMEDNTVQKTSSSTTISPLQVRLRTGTYTPWCNPGHTPFHPYYVAIRRATLRRIVPYGARINSY